MTVLQLRSVVREPLFQFLLLGFLLWAGSAYWSAHQSRYVIDITAADRQRIATNYLRESGQAPTAAQLQRLVERYVREEIFLREGRALNLQRDDEIVRRRIVQKYEFLQTDLAVPDAPTPALLQQWFEQHQSRYLSPERVAFSHVYFSTDEGLEATAKDRANKTLAKLRVTTHVPDLSKEGDAFAGPSEVTSLTADEVSRLFGESELSRRVFGLPQHEWSGPYRSAYGWHLVYVTGNTPAAKPALAEIRDRVLADYQDEERRTASARSFEKLRAKYTVHDVGGAAPTRDVAPLAAAVE